MPQFAYTARTSSGVLVTGTLSALSVNEATRTLRADGKFPLRVNEGAVQTSPVARAPAARCLRFRHDDVISFLGQMAIMVETGVAVAEALESCQNKSNSPGFASALEDVISKVQGGATLSAALGNHPRVFSTLLVSLVRASEASGTLGLMLRRASEFLSAERDLKKKIRGAVAYPIGMFCFAICVAVFLLAFVLPRFAAIYAGKEKALPALTRVLMGLSTGITTHAIYVIVAVACVAAGCVLYFRHPKGRRFVSWVKIRAPIIGSMFRQNYLVRSLRTLGTMIETNVAMLEAIELTRATCGNVFYAEMFVDVQSELTQGKQLSETLSKGSLIQRPIVQMIRAGERSGQLGAVLDRVARHCEAELAVSVKTMTALIEPLIIAFLGGVVGTLVIALLLPIFTISRAMRPG